jgi:hypothetical protein
VIGRGRRIAVDHVERRVGEDAADHVGRLVAQVEQHV